MRNTILPACGAALSVLAFFLATGHVKGATLIAAVSPSEAERLTANGLRADDPQLASKLQTLAQSKHRVPLAGPAAVVHFSGPAAIKRLLFGTPSHGSSVIVQAASSVPTPRPTPTSSRPVISEIDLDTNSNTYSFYPSPLLSIYGSNFGNGMDATVTMKMPTCGTSTLPYEGDGLTEWGFNYWPAKTESATLTITYKGQTSAPASFTNYAMSLPSGLYNLQVKVPIADVSPFFVKDSLGEDAGAYATSSKSHLSTDVTGPANSGTDVLGLGTSLLNGWTATAAISNVHSYRDSATEPGTNDSFRSATITAQPTLGRLETKVAWTFQAGESISYDVTWTLSAGTLGTRMVSTQGKQTPCTTEQ